MRSNAVFLGADSRVCLKFRITIYSSSLKNNLCEQDIVTQSLKRDRGPVRSTDGINQVCQEQLWGGHNSACSHICVCTHV